ncbi:MAG TPA: LptF/LptG family permease [Sedimentisphaerales bacterium]|nr:LptF/LptG family permease [Sedimentisphaerales bacterium]
MLFTLHRYIFRELLRVFILAVVALTLMLSLGSILQPVQEYGVGPRQVIHFMGYFLPITLTFVLPMAALFACSLVYGRFAGDSELDACRASGISLIRLVYPGLILAIMVTIANLLLSFYVMPVFVHRAEQSLRTDAKKILFRNIQRKRYYEDPDNRYLIYADEANEQNNTLSGVVVHEMNKKNKIKNIFTAEVAQIKFIPHEISTEVHIQVYKSGQMGAESEGGAEWGSFTMELGPMLSDEIKFKKIDQMRDIEADPMNFYPIAELARETYAQFIIELLAHDINTTIIDPSKNSPEDTNGADRYYELLGMPNSVRFTAGRCSTKEEELELSDENEVTVIEYDTESRQILRTLICEKAVLHIEGDKLTPTLTMDISNARKDGSDDIKMRDIIHGLIPPQIMDNFSHKVKTESGSLKVELLTFDLLELSGLQPSDSLKELESELSKEIRRALVQIIAEIHTRLVFGIGCIPMILIGIGLGIIKKGGHLLTAFGASCIPAAVLIVCMMSGKNLIKSQGLGSVTGIALMWAGLVFLILLVIAIYHRLLKN